MDSTIAHVPNNVHALINFALQALQEQRFMEATQACEAALLLDTNHIDAHFLLAFSYKELGHTEIAQALMARSVFLAPNNPLINYNAAVYAFESGDLNRAMIHYQQTLRIEANMPDALWNYGECLRLNEQFSLALLCFERLVAQKQTHYPSLWHRMAVCYATLGQHDEANAMFERALAEDQDMLSHWEYAFYLLSIDDYTNGTRFYNDRFLCDGRNGVYQHEFPYPEWDGTFSQKMTLLIHGEQGLGDEMMFASMFNELLDDADQAGAKVVIACKPTLIRLFKESFPRAVIRSHLIKIAPAEVSDIKIDAQMAMGHLMARYRNHVHSFTKHRQAYLTPNHERIEYYEQQIRHWGRQSRDGKRRFRVGLMWGANAFPFSTKFLLRAHQKSIDITLFADWADLLDDVEFISLQNNERGAEAAQVPQLNIIDFSLDQADFYDTAALIANLDLVISVDTSVSHLAGAMAHETWVPLMKFADWRHSRTRQESIWYKGTRYFRQAQPKDWSTVIASMRAALQERLIQWKDSL